MSRRVGTTWIYEMKTYHLLRPFRTQYSLCGGPQHGRYYVRWHHDEDDAKARGWTLCKNCAKKDVANPPITEGTATAKATGYAVAGAPSVSTPRSVRVEAT